MIYAIKCDNCQRSFDATATSWCNCIGKDQTLVCPHCYECFCSASDLYKREVWEGAPGDLLRKRLEHAKALAEEPVSGTESIDRPLILVVDDDEAILRLASRYLRRRGWGVATARDGLEGLAVAEQLVPEVILADALMPRLDGREMCRQIKQKLRDRAPRVIIMTGVYRKPAYRREAEQAYAVDYYIEKPINLDELGSLIMQWVS